MLPILFVSHARADDWARLDAKVVQASLCEAYVDGASYVFRRESCSRFGCDAYDYRIITHCGPGADGIPVATLDSAKMTGEVYSRETLTESRWREHSGNLLRLRASFVRSFGKDFNLVKVDDAGDGLLRAEYTVGANGKVTERGTWIFSEGPNLPQVVERRQIRTAIVTEENVDRLVTDR